MNRPNTIGLLLAGSSLCLASICFAPACRPPAPQNSAQEAPASAKSLANRLTSHLWLREQDGAFGYRETLRISPQGLYHWERTSDVTERDDQGNWTLVPHDADSGVLRLEATGDIPFQLTDNELWIGDSLLQRGDLLESTPEDAMKTEAHDVAPLDITQRLAATPWIKTNTFDDYRLPSKLVFRLDGSFVATYRDGQCQHEGLWGVLGDDSGGRFVSRSQPNECDLRGGSAGLSGQILDFDGELLLLGNSYAPQDRVPPRQVFVFDRYSGSMQTRGEFEGKLTRGTEIDLNLTMSSKSGADFQLLSLDIGFEPLQLAGQSYSARGEPVWLVQQDLRGAQVTALKSLTHQVKLTPPISGTCGFVIRIRYRSSTQDWDGNQMYLVDVEERE